MQRNLPFVKRTGILLLMILYLSTGASAQTKISGKVTASDDNMPVPGASVKMGRAVRSQMKTAYLHSMQILQIYWLFPM
jgi:hypothetical protein